MKGKENNMKWLPDRQPDISCLWYVPFFGQFQTHLIAEGEDLYSDLEGKTYYRILKLQGESARAALRDKEHVNTTKLYSKALSQH